MHHSGDNCQCLVLPEQSHFATAVPGVWHRGCISAHQFPGPTRNTSGTFLPSRTTQTPSLPHIIRRSHCPGLEITIHPVWPPAAVSRQGTDSRSKEIREAKERESKRKGAALGTLALPYMSSTLRY